MRQLLVWLQHLFILLPAIGTLYVTDVSGIPSYISYTLLTLLFIRTTEFAPASAHILIPIEIIGFGWLYSSYGGLLFFLLFSAIISSFLYFRKPIEITAMVILAGIVVNVITAQQSLMIIWVANLIGLSLVILLVAYERMEHSQRKLELAHELLTYRNEQLVQEQERTMEYARKVEGYAQVEERGRIANEIHDDLGHRLIRVKMMTEAVLQIMNKDPQQANLLLTQVRDQMEESMNNMRYTVRKLRPLEAQIVRRYALHRLIEDAARDMQITVNFQLMGKPYPLYPSIEYVLYRNAQEAITNAVRHGGAHAVEIGLSFAEDQVRMDITNDGKLPERVTYGLGLKGMQERLSMLGGQLEVALKPSFIITTILPYSEANSKTLEGV